MLKKTQNTYSDWTTYTGSVEHFFRLHNSGFRELFWIYSLIKINESNTSFTLKIKIKTLSNFIKIFKNYMWKRKLFYLLLKSKLDKNFSDIFLITKKKNYLNILHNCASAITPNFFNSSNWHRTKYAVKCNYLNRWRNKSHSFIQFDRKREQRRKEQKKIYERFLKAKNKIKRQINRVGERQSTKKWK